MHIQQEILVKLKSKLEFEKLTHTHYIYLHFFYESNKKKNKKLLFFKIKCNNDDVYIGATTILRSHIWL